MRFGMGMLAGVVLGIFLGAAITAGTASTFEPWVNESDALKLSPQGQMAYIAGVGDAMEAISDAIDHALATDSNVLAVSKTIGQEVTCMEANGQTLGEFRDWAVGVWTKTASDDSAAAVLLGWCAEWTR